MSHDAAITLTTVNFPALSDANYSEWVIRMEAELVRKDLWDVIELPAPTKDLKTEKEIAAWHESQLAARDVTKMAKARAEIIQKVQVSQLSHMRSRDPREIWLDLARMHVAQGLATRLRLRRQFLRLVKDVSEPMSAWIGRVKEMAFRLEDVGVKVDDEDRILALTNGLDDSYEAFVISLDATPTAQLTLEYVVNRLLNEEMRRGNTQAADRDRNGQTALHMGTKSSGRPGAETGGMPTCWRCGKPGHIKAFCREEPMRRSDNEERGRANFAVSELVDLGSVEIGRVL